MGKINRAIFIDKDGTLINDVPYNVNPALISLAPHAGETMKALRSAGYLLVLISNQSGVARGMFDEHALDKVNSRLQRLLHFHEVHLDGIYYCPHHPEGTVSQFAIECNCRKPKAGMLFRASHDLQIDLSQSWMIGDILHDIEAGSRAGCQTILLDNGNETEWHVDHYRMPTYRVHEWREVLNIILHNYEFANKSTAI